LADGRLVGQTLGSVSQQVAGGLETSHWKVICGLSSFHASFFFTVANSTCTVSKEDVIV
jgi:hypothetical protein